MYTVDTFLGVYSGFFECNYFWQLWGVVKNIIKQPQTELQLNLDSNSCTIIYRHTVIVGDTLEVQPPANKSCENWTDLQVMWELNTIFQVLLIAMIVEVVSELKKDCRAAAVFQDYPEMLVLRVVQHNQWVQRLRKFVYVYRPKMITY